MGEQGMPGTTEGTSRVDNGVSGLNEDPAPPLWVTENSTDHGLSSESRIVLITLYTMATALSVVGNVVVIVVFTVGKRSRTDLRGYLINLAVSDLVMASFCMPFTFTMTMLGDWIFTKPMCPVVLYMQTVSVTASVGTNMAIGIDRFWVVRYPLRSRVARSRSKFVICSIWLIALTSSSIQLAVGRAKTREIDGRQVTDCNEVWPSPTVIWRRTYTLFIFVLTYVLPLGILTGTYGILGLRLWRRTAPGNANRTRDKRQIKSKRKVIKMLTVVVALFAVCWLPLHVFVLLMDFKPDLFPVSKESDVTILISAYYTVHWLAMSNSFVNPIIYSFLNETFRHDLFDILRRCLPCCDCCWRRVALSRGSTDGGRSTYMGPMSVSSTRTSGANCRQATIGINISLAIISTNGTPRMNASAW